MKMFRLLVFLLILGISIIIHAQTDRYFHADTLNISTTARDTTFSIAWEEVTIYADTVDVLMKVGAPDVGSWTSRNWMRLNNGQALTIGPRPRLSKLSVKTVNGTGVLYLIGWKNTRQY